MCKRFQNRLIRRSWIIPRSVCRRRLNQQQRHVVNRSYAMSYLIRTVGLDVKRRTLPVTWPTLASVPFVSIMMIISTSSLSAISAILILQAWLFFHNRASLMIMPHLVTFSFLLLLLRREGFIYRFILHIALFQYVHPVNLWLEISLCISARSIKPFECFPCPKPFVFDPNLQSKGNCHY